MSLFTPTDLTVTGREKIQDAFLTWVGGSPQGQLLTEATNDLDDLQAAAGATPGPSAAARTNANFANALYRDAYSAFATRGQILTGGARARMVELHMGAVVGNLYATEAPSQ